MAKEIEFDKKIIRKLFDMWYAVPDYQRAYVWEKDQVQDLLEDTFAAYCENKDAQYFLGSMVLKTNEKTEDGVAYTEYELLDGQQRLTTILLILACMRDIAPRYQGDLAPFIYQQEKPVLQQPERMRILFNIRNEVRDFVNDYVKSVGSTDREGDLEEKVKGKAINVSVKNMANAILVIRHFLREHEKDLDGYLTYFLNKVLMIYVATEELHDAFQLFTVLNNRGVKLSNADILKAENLKMLAPNDRQKWAASWEAMESYFGENFDTFLSHIRTILVKKKQATTLLKEFEENIYSDKEYDRSTKQYQKRKPLLTKGAQTFSYIDGFYKTYQEVFTSDHSAVTGDYEINHYLQLMEGGLGVDYWMAPVLSYYQKFHRNQFGEFLKALDRKLSADWITSVTPTLRLEHVNDILRAIEACNSPEELLQSTAFQVNLEDLERVLRGDIYGKRFAKYLLLKLDLIYGGHTNLSHHPAVVSIEHILPQNPKSDSQWVMDYTEEDRAVWTDKLGNLVLISRRKNAAQGNLDYQQKKEKYFLKNVEVFPNSVRVYQQYGTWTLQDLERNHQQVVSDLLSTYNTVIGKD